MLAAALQHWGWPHAGLRRGTALGVLNLWGIGLPWSLLLIVLFAFGPVTVMLARAGAKIDRRNIWSQLSSDNRWGK
ncbi:MAG: hypothetical protein U0559_04845 [Anaerolineae bacterium]